MIQQAAVTHPLTRRDSRPTTVLVVGEMWDGCTGRAISDGLRAMGCDVSEVDPRYHIAVWRSLPLRVLARAFGGAMREDYRQAVRRHVETLRPDLLVAIKGTHLDREIFELCRKVGTSSAVYYPDYHFEYPGLDLDALLCADHFITTKSFQLDFLRSRTPKAKISFVHHGYAPGLRPAFASVTEAEFARDIAYTGTYTPEKARWIDDICRRMPNAKFEIFGENWDRAPYPAVRSIARPARYTGEYSRVIQTSRVNIALHMEPKGAQGWADQVSIRTFEIPACRGFMLHIDNDEVRSLYSVGEEIDVFGTPDELATKIEHYLAKPDRRSAMAAAAYARCVPGYSYFRRAEAILNIAMQQTAGASTKDEAQHLGPGVSSRP